MSPKRYPQKLYLFVCYGALILVLFCAFFAYFYQSYAANALKESKTHIQTVCTTVGDSINNELDNLSTISMNMVYSDAIRSNFDLFTSAEGYVGTRPGVQEIYDVIISMIGFYQSAAQVNLYNLRGEMVGNGYIQRAKEVNLQEYAWYEPTMASGGHRYLTQPLYRSNIPAEGENQKWQRFISLTRIFLNKTGEPEGIVEVVQDCHKIFSLIPELRVGNSALFCYVYNERGDLIYPYWEGEWPDGLLERVQERPETLDADFLSLDDGAKVLASSRMLEKYEWTVVVLESESAVYSGLSTFRSSFLFIISLSLFITMYICFAISKQLTKPLDRLASAARETTLTQVMERSGEMRMTTGSRIQEIALLYQSFQDMTEKLSVSLAEAMAAHAEETKAQLRATQSMINPHFLYNSLTTVSVMAEEGMNEGIVRMCQLLCDYFRYISSADNMLISMEQELLHTRMFIDCMQMRFGDEFSYRCRLEPGVETVTIPKLIVQPFVENAFKHAFNMPPPWSLDIHAYLSGGSWMVDIEDNGGNLTDETKQALLESCKQLETSVELDRMTIGGMGLKNVCLRLKLLYGNGAVFRIDNTKKSRTIFTIGGPVKKAEQQKEVQYGRNPAL